MHKGKKHKESSSQAVMEESVIDLIKEDHKKVKSLFSAYEKTEGSDQKNLIMQEVITELNVHTALEEEIFYPALRKTLSDEEDMELMDEALEEHHVVHLLIKELESESPDSERHEAKFKVLEENVRHHLKEEESELLPKAKGSEVDSEVIAQKMIERKEELNKIWKR